MTWYVAIVLFFTNGRTMLMVDQTPFQSEHECKRVLHRIEAVEDPTIKEYKKYCVSIRNSMPI